MWRQRPADVVKRSLSSRSECRTLGTFLVLLHGNRDMAVGGLADHRDEALSVQLRGRMIDHGPTFHVQPLEERGHTVERREFDRPALPLPPWVERLGDQPGRDIPGGLADSMVRTRRGHASSEPACTVVSPESVWISGWRTGWPERGL